MIESSRKWPEVVCLEHRPGGVQPGAGINGRPELQGIMENAALRRKLVLGISDACTGATRFWSLWDRHREIPLARDLKGLVNLTVARSMNPPRRV